MSKISKEMIKLLEDIKNNIIKNAIDEAEFYCGDGDNWRHDCPSEKALVDRINEVLS